MKTRPARYDRDEVVAALNPLEVLQAYSIKVRRSGGELRTRHCPACGTRSRESVTVNLETGMWQDHAHGCSGDVLALLAGLAGLDARRDFARVLELAAQLAGVDATTTADPQRVAERRVERAARTAAVQAAEQQLEKQRRTAAVAKASLAWDGCDRRHAAGEEYLVSRGLRELVGRDALVRFARRDGDVVTPLLTADGLVVNMVIRHLPGSARERIVKVRGLAGCPTLGTFGHALSDIVGPRDVVLVEGMFDALSALSIWPDVVVLGAHGAGNVAKLGLHAARRASLAGGRLILVPHADTAGQNAMRDAGVAAVGVGLRLRRDLFVLQLDTKDLNDSLQAHGREYLRRALIAETL